MAGTTVRVKLNSAGVRALLNSPEVAADLAKRADAIAHRAGPGFEASTRKGPTRVRASVVTATREARKAEAESRALTSAIDAGR